MNTILLIAAACLLFVGVNTKSDSRVIGGTGVITAHFCGGVLMRPQWVLTSGTCVYNATLFTIQLGSHTLTIPDENRVTVATSEYVIHPEFNLLTLENDIGLIKLRMNVTYNDYLKNANFIVGTLPDGKELTVIGWGQTSDSGSGLSEHLQKVKTLALTNEECKLFYGNQTYDNMVCVEGNHNEGTCTHGDNGSPLLDFFRSQYYVVGVASFVSGNGCESTDPSGFTRTAPYFVWLTNTMDAG